MVKKPSKGGKEISILSDFFLPKGGKAPVAKYPLSRADIPNPTVTVNEPHDVATRVKSRSTDVPMIDLESIINEEDKRAHELILAKEIRIQAEAAQLVIGMLVKSGSRRCQIRKEMTLKNLRFNSYWQWTPLFVSLLCPSE